MSETARIEDMLAALAAGLTVTEITCTACRQRNRVRNQKLHEGKRARCGKCGLPIGLDIERPHRTPTGKP